MNPKAAPSLTVAQPFTPFPNVLIDEIMPTLKDSEWRLLCVIVRQTLGWIESDGKRKTRDWLSQKQLIARTGRNSAALSAAIDALVGRHLVETRGQEGELLLTPQQRRRHRGRIYYGLCPKILEHLTGDSAKTPLHKANTTKETVNKKNVNKEVSQDLGDYWDLMTRPETALTLYGGWEKAGHIAKPYHQNSECKRGS